MGLESPRLHGKPQGVEGALDQESSPWLLTLLGGQLTAQPCLSGFGKTMTVSKAGSRPCCGPEQWCYHHYLCFGDEEPRPPECT